MTWRHFGFPAGLQSSFFTWMASFQALIKYLLHYFLLCLSNIWRMEYCHILIIIISIIVIYNEPPFWLVYTWVGFSACTPGFLQELAWSPLTITSSATSLRRAFNYHHFHHHLQRYLFNLALLARHLNLIIINHQLHHYNGPLIIIISISSLKVPLQSCTPGRAPLCKLFLWQVSAGPPQCGF